MGDWNVDVDEAAQRVNLTIHGNLGQAELAKMADACEDAGRRLDPGFDCVNDMATFVPADDAALTEIERGKEALAAAGMAAAVRVESESTTGQMQFDRAGEGVESYAVAKAESIEAAKRLLDQR